jgi:hypothetical protein
LKFIQSLFGSSKRFCSTRTKILLRRHSSRDNLASRVKLAAHVFARREISMSNGGGGRSAGVGVWGFGSMLSITLSWSVHHSILWMIVHGIFSWFYVAYYAWMK